MESPLKKTSVQSVLPKKKRNDKAKEEKKTEENILTYDVLRIIFEYLSAKDLTYAAHLCRIWRDAANKELATRRTPECHLGNCEFRITQTENENSYQRLLCNKLRIKPAFAFICAKMEKDREWTPNGCFCAALPKSCITIQMGGYQVIENDSNIPESRYGVTVSAFFPQIPGLSLETYQLHFNSFKESTDEDIHSHANKIVKQLLPPDDGSENKRCIILLANEHGYKFNRLVLKGIQKKYKPGTISLWGGICVDLRQCHDFKDEFPTCSRQIYWTSMSITSPSLESYSLVIPQSCRQELQMIEKLEKLRKNIKLKKLSLGFMFACIERVKRKDLEIKVFKKVFPEVPLFGLHGDGECGLDTLSTKRDSELHHSYSTIFLILTYS
ncbi:F-box only protein 22-like [Nasonia vitripennis]|uniref:F-box domain-containing protein n=1 Tax=Nasonia vitripennis TaxID=7425 RepID=A0A7M7HB88_NASVI|nr:F-box only protein 22-like [Nasonia vitripennis]